MNKMMNTDVFTFLFPSITKRSIFSKSYEYQIIQIIISSNNSIFLTFDLHH